MERQQVLLVGPEQEENLSLRYLASSLIAAGHDALIAPFDRVEELPKVVAAAREATLVGLSLCFQVRAPEFLLLARALKAQAPARPIVAGGHYASCAADELLRHHPEIDLIVVHEGEATLVELADAASAGELPARLPTIRGLVLRHGDELQHTEPRPVCEDLDRLPLPWRSGPARLHAGVPTAYMLGSRGCVGSCHYCCITTLHRQVPGKRFRQRDPAHLAEELAQLYHERGVRQFIFHDDNFLVPAIERNHQRLDALQAALAARGVHEIAFTIKCRPREVEESIFRRLRELGLIRVFLGVESVSVEGLACLGRQQTRAEAAAALQLCHTLGISAQFTMMIFHPAATRSSCAADLAFMKEHLAYPLNFCRTELYAGTPLEQQMLAAGRARGDYLGRSYTIPDPLVQWVCDTSTSLFLARCWRGGGLMERAIGLDHLAAVMRRFYRGRQAEGLEQRIRAWLLAVNQSTVTLLEALFAIGEQPLAERPLALALLAQEEQASRGLLLSSGLALFNELNALTLSLVGLRRDESKPQPRRRRLARHAAAALLAVSVASWAGCKGEETGQSEFAPPPVDGGRRDAQVDLSSGQSEFAAPPVDGGRRDARVDLSSGQAEFAAPPVDGGGERHK